MFHQLHLKYSLMVIIQSLTLVKLLTSLTTILSQLLRIFLNNLQIYLTFLFHLALSIYTFNYQGSACLKKDSKLDCCNCRPISLLSNAEKILSTTRLTSHSKTLVNNIFYLIFYPC